MPVGKKAAQTHLRPRPRSDHVPALLLVLLIIIALFVVGVAAVKLLIWLAILLAIIWLIGFFVRGAEGARWYRW
jgi:type II secretory pathway component PulF